MSRENEGGPEQMEQISNENFETRLKRAMISSESEDDKKNKKPKKVVEIPKGLSTQTDDSQVESEVPGSWEDYAMSEDNTEQEPNSAGSEPQNIHEKSQEQMHEETDLEKTVYIRGRTTNITKVNTLRTRQSLEEIAGDLKLIQRSKDSLKVICRTTNDKVKLMKINSLLGYAVTITEPFQLRREQQTHPNRGIIFGVHSDITNEEMTTSLGLKAERIFKKRGSNSISTERMIIYSDSELPAYVYDGWNRYKVTDYIPEPVRCFRCQHFGHKALTCRANKEICSICAGNHETKNCPIKDTHRDQQNARCPNCGGPHTASFRGCIRYQQELEIKKVQITGKISYAEAVQKCRNQGTDNPHIPRNDPKPGQEASQQRKPDNPPPGEHPTTATIGTNTDEINTDGKRDDKNEHISKKLVNNFVHTTLRVIKDEDTKEDMVKKIIILLRRLMAIMKHGSGDDTAETSNRAADLPKT